MSVTKLFCSIIWKGHYNDNNLDLPRDKNKNKKKKDKEQENIVMSCGLISTVQLMDSMLYKKLVLS